MFNFQNPPLSFWFSQSEGGWDSYFILIVAGLIATSIPIALACASRFVSSRLPETHVSRDTFDRSQKRWGEMRVNARFFLAILGATVLVLFCLLVTPIVAAFSALPQKATLMLIFVFSLSWLALSYATKKGDLSWIETLTSQEQLSKDQDEGRNEGKE